MLNFFGWKNKLHYYEVPLPSAIMAKNKNDLVIPRVGKDKKQAEQNAYKITSEKLFSSFRKRWLLYAPTILLLSSVQSLSHLRLFATSWIAACQASLSITNSQSSPKLMCIESVMPSSHLILCRPLFLLPPILLLLLLLLSRFSHVRLCATP